jgi:hypothetical protein
MSISPDGKVLSVTSGSTLQWLCVGTLGAHTLHWSPVQYTLCKNGSKFLRLEDEGFSRGRDCHVLGIKGNSGKIGCSSPWVYFISFMHFSTIM